MSNEMFAMIRYTKESGNSHQGGKLCSGLNITNHYFITDPTTLKFQNPINHCLDEDILNIYFVQIKFTK